MAGSRTAACFSHSSRGPPATRPTNGQGVLYEKNHRARVLRLVYRCLATKPGSTQAHCPALLSPAGELGHAGAALVGPGTRTRAAPADAALRRLPATLRGAWPAQPLCSAGMLGGPGPEIRADRERGMQGGAATVSLLCVVHVALLHRSEDGYFR